MTESYDPRAEILWSGVDDWVSLAEAAAIVADERVVATETVRIETLDILAGLLKEGLVHGGEVMGGFQPWGLEPDAALARIRERWADPARELSLFEGTWFANTAAGEALAYELPEAGLTSCPEDQRPTRRQ
jgi:hypothetical protein